MSEIKLYDSQQDVAAWECALEVHGDVYFSPKWLDLHLFDQGARGMLFHYSEGDNSWLYPFIMRPLPACYGVEAFDIESAYGYGGPVSTIDDETFVKTARSAFETWCKEQKIIAEFCAFHPVLGNERWMQGELDTFKDRNTVSLSLGVTGDPGDTYSRDGRYMIRRGLREGLVVQELDIDTHFERFVEMYLNAMKSLGATDFYSFNETYFKKLKQLVGSHGWLMVASLNDEWAAASIFLHGNEFMHYHLSANNFKMKAPGATNMILDAAAIKGTAMGLKVFHLGGGRTADEKDSLLKFKLSMGDKVNDFIIGKCVHNASIYERVVEQWKQDHAELEKTHGNRLLKYRLD